MRSVEFNSDPDMGRRYLLHKGIPDFSGLARRAFERLEFKRYRDAMTSGGQTDLVARVDYKSVCSFWGGLLSDIVHSPVAMWNMLSWDHGTTPQYSEEDFDLWADLHEETQHMSLLWVLLAHEGMFQSIERQNPQQWSVLLDPAEIAYLAKVDGSMDGR